MGVLLGGDGQRRIPRRPPPQVDVTPAGPGNGTVTAAYPYHPLYGATQPPFGVGAPSPITFPFHPAATMRAIP